MRQANTWLERELEVVMTACGMRCVNNNHTVCNMHIHEKFAHF